ncbi:hypothetical protein HAX54_018744, partial [Datura stramonium]|nr:hypothetical protein [Datura stramonium]
AVRAMLSYPNAPWSDMMFARTIEPSNMMFEGTKLRVVRTILGSSTSELSSMPTWHHDPSEWARAWSVIGAQLARAQKHSYE